MHRWLLPLVTVLALIGQAVTSYAAAGVVGEASCCCPQPSKCKCHDHDGAPAPSQELQRCSGEAKLVPLAVAIAIAPIQIEITYVPIVRVIPLHAIAPLPDDVSRTPEKPPF